jgi:AcrR family transcriptional regulator
MATPERRPHRSPVDGDPAPVVGARRPGRPRRPAVEAAVLDAAAQLLGEVGARGTTIDAIARRSGCSKTTIYRRWPTRDAILLEVLRGAAQGRPDDILRVIELERELGSTVHAAARRGAAVFSATLMRAVLPLIARELLADTPIGEGFRREVFRPIRAAANDRLRGAVDRGEVSDDVDGDLVFDAIYGAMLYRSLVGAPIDEGVAERLGDLVMGGAAGPSYRPRRDGPAGGEDQPGSRAEGSTGSPQRRSRAAR